MRIFAKAMAVSTDVKLHALKTVPWVDEFGAREGRAALVHAAPPIFSGENFSLQIFIQINGMIGASTQEQLSQFRAPSTCRRAMPKKSVTNSRIEGPGVVPPGPRLHPCGVSMWDREQNAPAEDEEHQLQRAGLLVGSCGRAALDVLELCDFEGHGGAEERTGAAGLQLGRGETALGGTAKMQGRRRSCRRQEEGRSHHHFLNPC